MYRRPKYKKGGKEFFDSKNAKRNPAWEQNPRIWTQFIFGIQSSILQCIFSWGGEGDFIPSPNVIKCHIVRCMHRRGYTREKVLALYIIELDR
jgi:hypothetical protein